MTSPLSPGSAGTLYVVATPIGNLKDLSPRALEVLTTVDAICAEDTRNSAGLLAHFGVKKPLLAVHEHNEDQVVGPLVQRLQRGDSLALISDAGTPLISDPGFVLVRAARAAAVPVIAIPGPCAAVAALSISGIASDRFLFVGFLPAKASQRRIALQKLAFETATLVLYESSHRIADCLTDLLSVLGPERRCCVARELTKLYEESHTAALSALPEWLRSHPHREKGEFVLVIEGASERSTGAAEAERILRVLLQELGASQAARLAAELTGMKKRELYAWALRETGKTGSEEPED